MSTVVTLPYDPVWQAVEWAKENCPSYITNRVHYSKSINDSKIDYYFGDERDAAWFSLKWK